MRIAAIQCPAIFVDATAVCDVVVDHMRWAATRGVDLAVLPEAFLLGHADDEATIAARAGAVSASALAVLCGRVAGFPTTLVIGAFHGERDDFVRERPPSSVPRGAPTPACDGSRRDTGAPIFNSAFVIEQGRVIGHYDKAYPNESGVTAGSDFPVFTRSGRRYGINICNDANHADAAAAIARQGADLIVYPLNNMLRPDTAERWREKSIANLADRARENGCWVASSDVAGACGDLVSHGCTAIVAPDGRVVARVPEGEHGVAAFDIPAP